MKKCPLRLKMFHTHDRNDIHTQIAQDITYTEFDDCMGGDCMAWDVARNECMHLSRLRFIAEV